MAFSTVASAAPSTLLLSASNRRRKLLIANSDANKLYVLLGPGTAPAANFSFVLAQEGSQLIEGYAGEVRGRWAGDGSGHALITEW